MREKNEQENNGKRKLMQYRWKKVKKNRKEEKSWFKNRRWKRRGLKNWNKYDERTDTKKKRGKGNDSYGRAKKWRVLM